VHFHQIRMLVMQISNAIETKFTLIETFFQLFRSIQTTCADLTKTIEKYQKCVCGKLFCFNFKWEISKHFVYN